MKIKALFSIALMTLGATMLHAATVTRNVPVDGTINALVTSASIDVVYTVSPGAVKVSVTGPDNLVPMVQVVKKGQTLNIGVQKPKDVKKLNLKGLKVTVNGPVVYAVKAYTSSDIKFTNALNVSNKLLKLYADTSADIEIPEVSSTGTVLIDSDTSADIKIKSIRADKLSISTDTSADVEINTVNVTTLNLDSDTGGDIKLGTVSAGIVGAKADTGADIEIATLTARILDARADTGADIKIRNGRADKIKAHADTGADINLKELSHGEIEKTKDTGGAVKTK